MLRPFEISGSVPGVNITQEGVVISGIFRKKMNDGQWMVDSENNSLESQADLTSSDPPE